jgi:hypothetical protein
MHVFIRLLLIYVNSDCERYINDYSNNKAKSIKSTGAVPLFPEGCHHQNLSRF